MSELEKGIPKIPLKIWKVPSDTENILEKDNSPKKEDTVMNDTPSEDTPKKSARISLGELQWDTKKRETEEESPNTVTEEKETKEEKNTPPEKAIKISIQDLQSDTKGSFHEEKETNTNIEKEEEEEDEKVQEPIPQEIKKTPIVTLSNPKISLSSIVSSNEASDLQQANKVQRDKEKGEKDAALKIQHLEDKKNERKVFGNYESQFEKESTNFVERIKNFWKRPQTRIGFVIGVIILWIGVILGLMILQPERHSFSIYKANIIYMYHSTLGKGNSPSANSSPVDNPPIEDTLLDTPPIGEENINTPPDIKEQERKEKLREYLQNRK